MVNKTKKGYRRERQCVHRLEDKGYLVHRKTNNAYDSSDMFGLFDVVAVKPGEPVRFIQVKSNSIGQKSEYKSAFMGLPQEHCNTEIWTFFDYKGWKIERLINDEWQVIVDER